MHGSTHPQQHVNGPQEQDAAGPLEALVQPMLPRWELNLRRDSEPGIAVKGLGSREVLQGSGASQGVPSRVQEACGSWSLSRLRKTQKLD